jgi:hypothetical protein
MMARMKRTLVLVAVASVAVTGSAAADMAAGWDFSQYQGQQYMDTDSSFVYKDTLEANYSDFDASLGAGRNGVLSGNPCPAGASCSFGMLYFDGSFGSTAIPEVGFLDSTFTPISGSLLSNFDAPGTLDFDSHTALQSEGQLFADAYRMQYRGSSAASIVFAVDLSSESSVFTDWDVIFAANTASGTASLNVAFATTLDQFDVPEFGTDTAVALNTTDTKFTMSDLGLAGLDGVSDMAWVRIAFSGTNGAPNIDDVSVFATLVPEPATALLLMSGLVGMAVAGRRRA